MDFLKILRSFEELLFEVLSWLVYYPRTMWMLLRHPLETMDYSDRQLRLTDEKAYSDSLSPPLLLLLTILLAHGVALALATASHLDESGVTTRVFGSHQNLVLARSLAYAVFPLVAAFAFVRRAGQSLDRSNLRPAFFAQCYLAAPYTLAVSLGVLAIETPQMASKIIGGAVVTAAVLWYIGFQAKHYRHKLRYGLARGFAVAFWVYGQSLAIVVSVAVAAMGALGLNA